MAVQVQPSALDTEKLVRMYRQMIRIRSFENRIYDLYRGGEIRGSSHAYVGEEAIAVGACEAIRPDDYISSTHRGHGHCIAKGARVDLMMAELLGKATGYGKGKGGSMHIADVSAGNLGANGIVGGGIGMATGAALSARIRGTDQVSLCFFGDGANNQGALHECANLAGIWKLPIIYLCENNRYAMSTRVEYGTAVADLAVRAVAWGFPGINVDGNDPIAIYETVSAAAARARAGQGPTLIVGDTYRILGHYVADPLNYRTKEEVELEKRRDPIARFRRLLIERELLDEAGADAIEAAVLLEIEAAVEFARQSPEPAIGSLWEDVYA